MQGMVSSFDERGGVCCRYVWSEISPSVAILKTIGRYENTDYSGESGGLAEPLYRYFDTDALDSLVKCGPLATISLTLDAYTVEINTDTVHVTTSEPAPQ